MCDLSALKYSNVWVAEVSNEALERQIWLVGANNLRENSASALYNVWKILTVISHITTILLCNQPTYLYATLLPHVSHHLGEGSEPQARTSVLRRAMNLSVLALLLVASYSGNVLLDRTSELCELAGRRDPLQSLVRQTVDERILLDVAILALWTGALLPGGLQLGLAARAGHVPVAAGVDGPRPGIL